MAESTPSLRDDHRHATRRALIGAARTLFTARGYAATSIDDVASEARVTKGAVYHHFTNKAELFRAVYAEIEVEVEVASAEAGAGADDLIGAILRGVDAYLLAATNDDVRQIALIDAPGVLGSDPLGPPEDQPGHIGLRALVEGAIASGAIAPVDADSLTHLIRGGCLQAATLIARSPEPAATRAQVGATLHALIEGLALPS